MKRVSARRAPPPAVQEAAAALVDIEQITPAPVPALAPRPCAHVALAHSKAPSPIKDLAPAIAQQAAEVLSGALAFADIPENATEPPAEWVEELGKPAALKRFRLAKAALANAKLAPVGLTLARGVFSSALKAEAERQEAAPLNIAVQVVVPNLAGFEEMEIE